MLSQPCELIAVTRRLFQRLLSATRRDAGGAAFASLPQPVALWSGQPIGLLPFSLFLPHRLSQLVLKSVEPLVGAVDHGQVAAGNVVNQPLPGRFAGYGEPFNPDVVSRMVAAWLAKAGLKRRGCCHILRHTCANRMLENGADIRFTSSCLAMQNSTPPRFTPKSASNSFKRFMPAVIPPHGSKTRPQACPARQKTL